MNAINKKSAKVHIGKWGIAAILLGGFLVLGLYIAHWELRPHVLEIYFFNLAKGRAIFIRTPDNKTILIDGGQNDQVIRELTNVFPFYRRRIDDIILTSSLAKNAGGLSEVVDRYSIGKILEPEIIGTSTALDLLEKETAQKNLAVQKVQKGDSFEIDGVNFTILFPDPSFKFTVSNLPQMVISLSYGSTTALLLGDVSKTIQKTFISYATSTNIVEYSNGASDSGVSENLFNQLNPKYAIISKQIRSTTPKVPKNPPKKPPFHIEKQEKTQVVNLLEKGTVHFISNGEKFEII